jgi:hypothetical protein
MFVDGGRMACLSFVGCSSGGPELRAGEHRFAVEVRLRRQGLHELRTRQAPHGLGQGPRWLMNGATAILLTSPVETKEKAMKKVRGTVSSLVYVMAAGLLAVGLAGNVRAQDSADSTPMLRLYINPRTKVVYSEPGPGRRLLSEIPMSTVNSNEELRKTEEQLRQNQQQISELQQKNQQLEASNLDLTRQVADIKPAWRHYVESFQDKFQFGALFYANYRFYTHTGFQPQELTEITNPGPGNNYYNAFDVTRTYLNFYFVPTDDWTVRITPDMYKTIGSSNDKVGEVTGFGSNLDGDLGVRIKYAYLRYNSLWDKLDVPALKGGTVTFGEQANPFVAWQEDLYGFRFVNLVPWNYMGFSANQLGLAMQGPIRFFGPEKTYIDYDFGVYNNSSFHAFEETDTKQAMARVSLYPFGSTWRFQGLGITGFYNYGYGNTTPDEANIPTQLKGPDAHIERIAAMLHYTAEQWGIAGEFDYGYNAFSTSNLFSGSGPADEFGFPTGVQFAPKTTTKFLGNHCSSADPCYNPFSGFGAQTGAWNAILNNGSARQIGFDMFGHYSIPDTPFTLFGMFQWLMPNDKVNPNPLDFQRFVAGVSYRYDEYLRFALSSQNIIFYHNQLSLPVSYLERFDYAPGSKLNGILLPATGDIPFLVPRDTHSIFANVEFAY